ncbi:MAG: hypothetical protein ACRDGF_07980, partial [Chloroflexota bacterium]
ILPFSADAKTKVQSYISGGYINTVAMKKASPDRVKMILGVMDWLAAPFGTQEQELLFYGLKGKDYNADAQGDPHLINNGKLRSQYVPWQYISAPPYVEYYADIPGYAARVFPIEKALVDPKIAVSDATLGYYSPTDHTSQATAATTKMTDGINNIVLGRAPLSGWDGLVTNWKSSIGDKIRGEYLSSMGKA